MAESTVKMEVEKDDDKNTTSEVKAEVNENTPAATLREVCWWMYDWIECGLWNEWCVNMNVHMCCENVEYAFACMRWLTVVEL